VIFECVRGPGSSPASSTSAADVARGRLRRRVGEDRFTPAMAINKEIDLRFVLAYTPLEFPRHLAQLADGKLDPPLDDRHGGLDGVDAASPRSAPDAQPGPDRPAPDESGVPRRPSEPDDPAPDQDLPALRPSADSVEPRRRGDRHRLVGSGPPPFLCTVGPTRRAARDGHRPDRARRRPLYFPAARAPGRPGTSPPTRPARFALRLDGIDVTLERGRPRSPTSDHRRLRRGLPLGRLALPARRDALTAVTAALAGPPRAPLPLARPASPSRRHGGADGSSRCASRPLIVPSALHARFSSGMRPLAGSTLAARVGPDAQPPIAREDGPSALPDVTVPAT